MATRKEQADATREAIIHAGRALLSKKDASHVSISEIMKSCGLSSGLFYHYFESKDEFILMLVTQDWDTWSGILDDPRIPIIRRLREYCMVAITGQTKNNPQLHRNLNAYKMSDVYIEERERFYQDDAMLNCMLGFLYDCIEKGYFSPKLPVEYIAKLLLYVTHGIDYNAALYKREWNDWAWCSLFFDFVEQELLLPYYTGPLQPEAYPALTYADRAEKAP